MYEVYLSFASFIGWRIGWREFVCAASAKAEYCMLSMKGAPSRFHPILDRVDGTLVDVVPLLESIRCVICENISQVQ